MRYYSLLGLFWLLLPMAAFAQESPRLVSVGTNDQGASILLDRGYITQRASFTNVRTYERLSAAEEDGTTQKVFVYRFKCALKVATIESITKFDGNWKVTDYTFNKQIDKLFAVNPNTVIGRIYPYACP